MCYVFMNKDASEPKNRQHTNTMILKSYKAFNNSSQPDCILIRSESILNPTSKVRGN